MDEIRIPLHFREGMYHLNELPAESDDFLVLRMEPCEIVRWIIY